MCLASVQDPPPLFDQISQSNVILLPRHTPRLSFIAVPALPTQKPTHYRSGPLLKILLNFFSVRCRLAAKHNPHNHHFRRDPLSATSTI